MNQDCAILSLFLNDCFISPYNVCIHVTGIRSAEHRDIVLINVHVERTLLKFKAQNYWRPFMPLPCDVTPLELRRVGSALRVT
jgi:hypothetical protein